jgi:hypothetical protein
VKDPLPTLPAPHSGSQIGGAPHDEVAKLRGLPGELGYDLVKAPIRGCWFLVNEAPGQPAMSDRGTTAFSVERAIKLLAVVKTKTRPSVPKVALGGHKNKPPHRGG